MQRLKSIMKQNYIKYKFYRQKRNKNGCEEMLLFFIGNGYKQKHPGLVDRFKAIVGLYYIAKQNEIPFKLKYNYPFKLEEYLVPNETDWQCDDSKISYSCTDVKLIEYRAKEPLPVLEKSKVQYHCYNYEGLNLLKAHNIVAWEEQWADLFDELFVPSQKLRQLLFENIPDKDYIAVHIRFLNTLDNFEEGYIKKLSEREKESLIQSCLATLNQIKKDNQYPLMVFSDSVTFLKTAQENGYEVLPFDKIGHISYQAEKNVVDKAFIDFYAISMGKMVYTIRGSHLYNSAFPQYAAIVGRKEYKMIEIV